MPRSREGYRHDPVNGLSEGFETDAVVSPPTNFSGRTKFDTIVIGAGYAGLIAARDLVNAGQSVLLLEARDRLGGRTWTAKEGKDLFEMGGTWVHWAQAFAWTELVKYGLDLELIYTPNVDYPDDAKCVVKYNDDVWQMNPEQLNDVLDSAWTKFCNVDGLDARSIVAIPGQIAHGPFVDPKVLALYDKMTVADRLAECRERKILTELEYKCFVPWVTRKFGSSPEKSGMLDLFRYYRSAHGSCSFLGGVTAGYRLRDGQTVFARAIFNDALSKQRLAYSFDTPVKEIQDLGRSVKVVTTNGTFEASKVVCTTPLNITNEIKFSPPLSPTRKEAFDVGSVAFAHKIHCVVSKPALRSKAWSAYDAREPVGLASAVGVDYTHDKKSSVIVAFGSDSSDLDQQASKHPELINKWLGRLDPELQSTHQRSIWHEWVTDPWLKGGWSMFGPEFYSKYWPELVKPHGNVEFASADYPLHGWKGFIDGAISEGARAAQNVVKAAAPRSRL
ncbi:hypothetical protein JCM6882_005454 [Rhodosporidiobolus microsporus]